MTNETDSKTNKQDEGKPVLKFETRPYDESLSEKENIERIIKDILKACNGKQRRRNIKIIY